MRVICPDRPRWPGDDMLGCGHKFDGEPDFEGLFDCPACGLWFVAGESGSTKWMDRAATVIAALMVFGLIVWLGHAWVGAF
jgi:hypothetical protein